MKNAVFEIPTPMKSGQALWLAVLVLIVSCGGQRSSDGTVDASAITVVESKRSDKKAELEAQSAEYLAIIKSLENQGIELTDCENLVWDDIPSFIDSLYSSCPSVAADSLQLTGDFLPNPKVLDVTLAVIDTLPGIFLETPALDIEKNMGPGSTVMFRHLIKRGYPADATIEQVSKRLVNNEKVSGTDERHIKVGKKVLSSFASGALAALAEANLDTSYASSLMAHLTGAIAAKSQLSEAAPTLVDGILTSVQSKIQEIAADNPLRQKTVLDRVLKATEASPIAAVVRSIVEKFSGSVASSTSSSTTTTTTTTTSSTYAIGGTVAGLATSTSVILQNNSGDDLTVSADGTFTFATELDDASAYAVTVKTNPTNQECSVTNATGTLASAAITSVEVACISIPTLDYSNGILALTKGTAMATFDPAALGGFSAGFGASITTCTVDPALPAGLSISTACVITGTPTASHATTNHTITATNDDSKTASDTIQITVSENFVDSSSGTLTGTMAGLKFDSGAFQIDTETDCSGASAAAANRNCQELSAAWTPQHEDLIVYFNMDDAVDEINNITATTSNTAFSATGAKAGNSGLDLTDANHEFFIPTTNAAFNIGTGDFTISYWNQKTGESGAWAKYFTWGDPSQATHSFLSYESGGNYHGHRLNYRFGGSSSTGSREHDVNGHWNYHVITRSSGTVNIYHNGILVETEAIADNLTTELVVGGPIFLYGDDGWSGSAFRTENGRNFGYVDEFAMWNVALTQDEINIIFDRQLALQAGTYTSRVFDSGSTSNVWDAIAWITDLPYYKSLPGDVDGDNSPDDDSESTSNYSALATSTLQTSLKGSWDFNSSASGVWTTATTLSDSSGHGVTLSPDDNTGTSRGPGKVGNAAHFDPPSSGNGGGTEITGDPGSGSAVTMGGWLKTVELGGPTTGNKVFDLYFAATLYINTHWIDYNGSMSSTDYAYGGPQAHSAHWFHYMVVDDPTGLGYLRTYLNGVQISDDDNSAQTINWNTTLRIGDDIKGGMDEVYLWDRGLSPTEILQLYYRGANRVFLKVKGCTQSDCSDNANWIGVDGDIYSFLSELQNSTAGSPSVTFANHSALNTALTNKRYFQYKLYLETDTTAHGPKVTNITITP